jgi:flagellar FliJ protein
MKRFAFRLETVLRHRKNLEEKERNELFRLVALLNQQCDQLKKLQHRSDETLLELAEKKLENFEHAEIGWFYTYLDHLRREMDKCRKKIAQLEEQIQKQKMALVEASKRKKILDTLKAKKEKEYVSGVEKVEQKAVDEIVVIRFPQKNR